MFNNDVIIWSNAASSAIQNAHGNGSSAIIDNCKQAKGICTAETVRDDGLCLDILFVFVDVEKMKNCSIIISL